MLLNKLPCLDKGYVAHISTCNDQRKIRELVEEFSPQANLYPISAMTLVIKCPLFVQLYLSKFHFNILTTKQSGDLETFIPNETEIGSPETETNRLISDDIKRTSAALLINPKAYQSDGCDHFISQVVTPINIYTTIIVHGTKEQWGSLINEPLLPYPIEAFKNAIQDIYIAEWGL